MPTTAKTNPSLFVFLLTITSIVSLVLATLISPPTLTQYLPFIILVLFITVLVFFPLELLNNRFYLIQIIVFTGGILYGVSLASWACVLGIGTVTGIQLLRPRKVNRDHSARQSTIIGASLNLSLNLVALVLAFSFFGIANGIESIIVDGYPNWIAVLGAGVVFGILHGSLYTIGSRLIFNKGPKKAGWDILALISIEILPLFLGFTALLLYPILENGSLVVLGVSTFAIALLLHYLSAPRKDLERRIQELSALDEISKALSSNIDLEKLLKAIQVQVTNLLNVDNFYVALLDPVDQQLWYPLAVKNGLRQNWPRRPLTDRLTDRVILESKAILLPHHAGQQIADIGLPSSEDAPYAWIGVPLITSRETIGCLALFSLTSDVEFSPDDLNVLSILSGQTSVAIEIALHNALLSSDVTIGRDRLTTVLNTVQDGLLLLNMDGTITLVNEAILTLTGYPQSEFMGRKLKELPTTVIHTLGYSVDEIDDLMEHITQEQESDVGKTDYRIENHSTEKVIERYIIPVLSKSDNPSDWIILLRDITEEYNLKQAQDLISETLVHDLRSPLSSTISALDVIQDSLANGDPAGIVEPSIQIAQRSSRRVLAMVESILEITRMESGKIDLLLSEIIINSIVDQSISEFNTVALEYKVSINKDLDDDLPPVNMDQEKIHRVLNNLIDNALKHTPENGQILISAHHRDGEIVEIQVSDSGPGIPEEYRQRIFERFVQVPGLPSRKRGSGLGLTYCRLAVEAHGGEIWVDDRPGGGSQFIFSLPISGQINNENQNGG
jgi:PAS domain S-box-containing protein